MSTFGIAKCSCEYACQSIFFAILLLSGRSYLLLKKKFFFVLSKRKSFAIFLIEYVILLAFLYNEFQVPTNNNDKENDSNN